MNQGAFTRFKAHFVMKTPYFRKYWLTVYVQAHCEKLGILTAFKFNRSGNKPFRVFHPYWIYCFISKALVCTVFLLCMTNAVFHKTGLFFNLYAYYIWSIMNIDMDSHINTSSIQLISCNYMQNNSLQNNKTPKTMTINKEWTIRKNLAGASDGKLVL